jgi:hypothetical protein
MPTSYASDEQEEGYFQGVLDSKIITCEIVIPSSFSIFFFLFSRTTAIESQQRDSKETAKRLQRSNRRHSRKRTTSWIQEQETTRNDRKDGHRRSLQTRRGLLPLQMSRLINLFLSVMSFLEINCH